MENNETQRLIDEELNTMQKPMTGEKLPKFKLEEKKVKKIHIDFEKDYPFQEYRKTEESKDKMTGEKVTIEKVTKMIPVVHNGERLLWWLNVKNPAYRELLERHKLGQSDFNITQIGNQSETKYEFVDIN